MPRPGLWLGHWSSVNPQGPHATLALGRLHGTPRAAAAPAMMLQRLAVRRRKGCHSIVVPSRRGRRRAGQLAPLLRVRALASGRTGVPLATSGHRLRPRRQRGGIDAPLPTQGRWVWRRLRWAAWSRAKPGRASALARASPALVTGLTMVASTASCAPCQGGKPLHTTSMRLAFCTGASTSMSAKRTFWATRPPQ